jgi:processive 1,2-diacylglycerol beta-glucosyltransferase
MAKRVLVLSASVGAGHLRAAQAVELALKQLDASVVVENCDVLEFANAAFRRIYGRAYLDLVNKAPHVLGFFYDMMDRRPSPRKRSDRLRLLVEKMNLRGFVRFLHEQPCDLVVNTHFLPAELIASLRQRGELNVPQFTVTTDFETHRLWVNQPCDRYFTATDEGAAYLEHWGVPANDVRPVGIPIHPVFSEAKPRHQCLERQGLRGDRPIVLQLAGGFGVGPVETLYRALFEVEVPLEIVVVSGRNPQLKSRLERVEVPARHRAKVLGFTDQMDELMAVADVVLSKPGGLTTSEVLARGAAMAVVNPIPGQESRNSDFLLENGAAIKINNIATLRHKLTPILRDADRLAALKANARRLGRPRAAFDVARQALAWA